MLEIDKIYNVECLEGMRQIDSESVDLLATDPPYALTSIVKRFGNKKSAPAKYGTDGLFQRVSSGFMGKKWDSDVPSVDIWKECLRILKPGAFGFVMCIPRQDSLARMICRLSDAGFETGFTSIYWAYATGFSKAGNIGKMVDRRLGAYDYEGGFDGGSDKVNQPGIPVTEEAKALDGSYAGFNPKPAVEVVLIVMKPLFEKTYVGQALENKKGISWFGNCRIPYKDNEKVIPFQYKKKPGGYGYENREDKPREINLHGRFPANLLVSDDVLNDGKVTGEPFNRYFSLDSWFNERIKQLPVGVQKVLPFLIVPKVSNSEKNKGLNGFENLHPTCKPPKLMSYLITLGSRQGDIVLDPFVGSGTTAVAARMINRHFIGFEINEEYYTVANARLKSIPVSLDSFQGMNGDVDEEKENQ